jgi:single-stranded DNA-binding protein
MRFLNSILIEGVLVDQPSSIQSPDGIPRCSFLISSDDEGFLIPAVAYGRPAQRYLEILKKGATVRLVGRIGRDLDATESSDRLRLRVVVEHLEIKGLPRSYSEVA